MKSRSFRYLTYYKKENEAKKVTRKVMEETDKFEIRIKNIR